MSFSIVSQIQKAYLREGLSILIGSVLMIVFSQVRIPIGPVPITMQTLGVFLVGAFFGAKRGGIICGLYLLEATVGLPVLANWKSNPLWFASLTSGYLFSFPLAAWIIGKMMERGRGVALSIMTGQLVIYLYGLTPLAIVYGIEWALRWGLVPFLLPAAIKVVLATSIIKGWRRWS